MWWESGGPAVVAALLGLLRCFTLPTFFGHSSLFHAFGNLVLCSGLPETASEAIVQVVDCVLMGSGDAVAASV